MNAVMEKLPALVEEELEAANSMHTVFHSPHEGWAVLKEEVEEAQDALKYVVSEIEDIWGSIKIDDAEAARAVARELEEDAVHLAAEAIQVAAMARKFQAIEPGAWDA